MTTNAYKLACSTKAKREALVGRIEALAGQLGVAVEAKPGALRERAITVYMQLAHYRVLMTFDGDSNVGAFLGHWHTEYPIDMPRAERDALPNYPKSFGSYCGGSVNDITWGKATTCVETFEELLFFLESGFAALKRKLEQHASEIDTKVAA